MKISLTSVSVEDQKAALAFYTEKLRFVKKADIPMGDVSWLTVVPPESLDGPELVLEPNGRLSTKAIIVANRAMNLFRDRYLTETS